MQLEGLCQALNFLPRHCQICIILIDSRHFLFFCDAFAMHWPRRSYNYRVVMVCGDAELDMRCLSEPVSYQDVVSEQRSCRFGRVFHGISWYFMVFVFLQPLPNAKDQTSVGKFYDLLSLLRVEMSLRWAMQCWTARALLPHHPSSTGRFFLCELSPVCAFLWSGVLLACHCLSMCEETSRSAADEVAFWHLTSQLQTWTLPTFEDWLRHVQL